MAFKMTGTVTGLKDLFDELKALPKKIQTKTLKDALNAAGRRVMWSAKNKVPVRTDQLRKSLGRRVKVYRNSGKVIAVVGPRHGFRATVDVNGRPTVVNPQKYSHLVELGASHSAAKPFLRPALEENVQATKDLVAEAVRKALASNAK
jgi:HK97 gp10 family phage protein